MVSLDGGFEIAFTVLAVVLVFAEGPIAAPYVALLIVGPLTTGELCSHPFDPTSNHRAAPALGLMSVIIFGGLFGIPGILIATPLMVVIMILVKRLYIEQTLEVRESTLNQDDK